MNLINADRGRTALFENGTAVEASAAAPANTAAGVASLGGRAAYFGKVADDQLGENLSPMISAHRGVHFQTKPLDGHPPTARSDDFS